MDIDPARSEADFAHCEALTRERDKDRFLASLFAPAAARPLLRLDWLPAPVPDTGGHDPVSAGEAVLVPVTAPDGQDAQHAP